MVPLSPTEVNKTSTFLSLESIRNIEIIQRISGISLSILIFLLQFNTCFFFSKNKILYSFFKWKAQILFYNAISSTKEKSSSTQLLSILVSLFLPFCNLSVSLFLPSIYKFYSFKTFLLSFPLPLFQ